MGGGGRDTGDRASDSEQHGGFSAGRLVHLPGVPKLPRVGGAAASLRWSAVTRKDTVSPCGHGGSVTLSVHRRWRGWGHDPDLPVSGSGGCADGHASLRGLRERTG